MPLHASLALIYSTSRHPDFTIHARRVQVGFNAWMHHDDLSTGPEAPFSSPGPLSSDSPCPAVAEIDRRGQVQYTPSSKYEDTKRYRRVPYLRSGTRGTDYRLQKLGLVSCLVSCLLSCLVSWPSVCLATSNFICTTQTSTT